MSELVGVGVDIGGTKIDIALVNTSGRILKRECIATRAARTPGEIQEDIINSIKKLTKNHNPPQAIGIGMAGQINPLNGEVNFAPNLDWHHEPLGQNFKKAFGLPVLVSNDVRVGTWGEWKYGAGKDSKNIICVFVGTGIGGGIVCDGKLLQGHSNTAGEVGHMVVDLHGPLCHCGNRGCVEAYAGGWAIARRYEEKAKTGKSITAKEVIDASLQGDHMALHVMDDALDALVALSLSLIHAFNPAKLIFNGGIVNAHPEFVFLIAEKVHQKALKSALLDLEIQSGDLKGDAGVIGAANMALSLINENRGKS